MTKRRSRTLRRVRILIAETDGTLTGTQTAEESVVTEGTLHNLLGPQGTLLTEAAIKVFRERLVTPFLVHPERPPARIPVAAT